jgi:hypothetical protein
MGSTIRRTLVRTIRYFILRPAYLYGVIAVMLAVVAAVLLIPTFAAGGPSQRSFGFGLPRPGGEPSATQEYMRGNREYNADLVWRSLSDEAQERLRGQGSSPESLQAGMQAAKDRGLVKVEEVSYIGGRDLPDGTSMQFYLVGYRASSKTDLEYVPYLFTLDRGGKIAKVQ